MKTSIRIFSAALCSFALTLLCCATTVYGAEMSPSLKKLDPIKYELKEKTYFTDNGKNYQLTTFLSMWVDGRFVLTLRTQLILEDGTVQETVAAEHDRGTTDPGTGDTLKKGTYDWSDENYPLVKKVIEAAIEDPLPDTPTQEYIDERVKQAEILAKQDLKPLPLVPWGKLRMDFYDLKPEKEDTPQVPKPDTELKPVGGGGALGGLLGRLFGQVVKVTPEQNKKEEPGKVVSVGPAVGAGSPIVTRSNEAVSAKQAISASRVVSVGPAATRGKVVSNTKRDVNNNTSYDRQFNNNYYTSHDSTMRGDAVAESISERLADKSNTGGGRWTMGGEGTFKDGSSGFSMGICLIRHNERI